MCCEKRENKRDWERERERIDKERIHPIGISTR